MGGIKLGDKVNVTATLQRRSRYLGRYQGTEKRWETKVLPNPRSGIYIGYRTLQNGKTVFEGSEEGYHFEPSEHFRAVLVVFSERERPVLVPMEALDLL